MAARKTPAPVVGKKIMLVITDPRNDGHFMKLCLTREEAKAWVCSAIHDDDPEGLGQHNIDCEDTDHIRVELYEVTGQEIYSVERTGVKLVPLLPPSTRR